MEWLSEHYIEIFGAAAGVIYVVLEIRQSIWLWPVGIVTSAVYIWVFLTSTFYADMSLQVYYLVISIAGWFWWTEGEKGREGEREMGRRGEREKGRRGEGGRGGLETTRLKMKVGVILALVFIALFFCIWLVLTNFTDSGVAEWDAFITSLSIVATWMLARKIYEHWYLWIIVNFVSVLVFLLKGLYPTVVLYFIYGIMSFIGLIEWKKTLRSE